jgi:hypothetical protein
VSASCAEGAGRGVAGSAGTHPIIQIFLKKKGKKEENIKIEKIKIHSVDILQTDHINQV